MDVKVCFYIWLVKLIVMVVISSLLLPSKMTTTSATSVTEVFRDDKLNVPLSSPHLEVCSCLWRFKGYVSEFLDFTELGNDNLNGYFMLLKK